MRDLYEILGANKTDDIDTLKKKYKKKCVALHPDKNVGKSEEERKKAEEEFKDVQTAWSVLNDKNKRARYDATGRFDGDGSEADSNPFDGFNFNFGGTGSPFDDLRNMFGGGFGGFGGGHRQQKPQAKPGQNIKMQIPLSIEDIYKGCTKTVKYKKSVRCSNCHGKGGTKSHTCPTCNGSGVVVDIQRTAFGMAQTQRVCPNCGGEGTVVDEKCPTCGGSGFKTVEVQQKVEFPSSIPHDGFITINGAGNESRSPQGANGSFIAIAKWNFDKNKYSIEGVDIVEKVELPYEDAILGTKITINLPDGKEYNVNIAPCTTPNKRYKLAKKGLSGKNEYGDTVYGNYIIEIVYRVPSVLDNEEIEALKKIKDVHTD